MPDTPVRSEAEALGVELLDPADRALLNHFDDSCRVPLSEISEQIGMSPQALGYRVNRLLGSGVVSRFYSLVNPHALGLRIYNLTLKLCGTQAEKAALHRYLRDSGDIFWIRRGVGSWDLLCTYLVRDELQFYSRRNRVLNAHSSVIVEADGQAVLEVQEYSNLLSDQLGNSCAIGGDVEVVSADALQREILGELVHNGRIPVDQLAKKIKATPRMVRARIKKLEESGVVVRYKSRVNFEALGLRTYYASFRYAGLPKSTEAQFLDYIARLPSLRSFTKGMWKFDLEFVVKDHEEYESLISSLRREFPELVKSVESMMLVSDDITPGAISWGYEEQALQVVN